MFFDPTFVLVLPALFLAMYAQSKVKSAYENFRQVPARAGLTGAETAHEILRSHGLSHVEVVETQGYLADHYDPRNQTVNLSPEVYRGDSLASLAIAAHECGHALQHANGYFPLQIRASILPVANLGSFAAFPLFFLGLFIQAGWLLNVGILLFLGAVVFHVFTLPVEFNASSRAMRILTEEGFLSPEETGNAKSVLDAAALTYVASAAMAILELLRLLILKNMVDGD